MRSKISAIVFLSAVCFPYGVRADFKVELTSPTGVSSITPAKTTGLEAVYVIEDCSGASLTFTSEGNGSVVWKRFGAMGGGHAEEITAVSINGRTSSVRLSDADMGYIVEENGRQTACWVVNYANHIPTITGISISQESDCDRVFFNPEGMYDKITYFSINGQPIELNRAIKLTYADIEPNSDKDGWIEKQISKEYSSITGTFSAEAPLRDCYFTLTGDRFLTEWGGPIILRTDNYTTKRVSAITSATQTERSNDNESGANEGSLGGSAPCEITFSAVPTDAVVYREWQFSTTEDFADILDRYNQDEITHTFTEYGTTYIRFIAADASGGCTYESETYTVSVGESKLECPNAFSPLNEDGVNDEWKVSYSSLVSFECHIFNRWGQKLFSSTNPAEGWDGRHGGKFVNPGVYFYVIKARGADGKKYDKSGDINIVGSRINPNLGGSSGE